MLPCFYASFGGDHVQNLSRIMRLPGTFNYKDARSGRPPQPCTLRACDPDIRFPLEAFSPWFEQADAGLSARKTGMSSVTASGVPAGQARCQPADIAEIVGRLQVPSRDRSRRDFAVICELLRLGLPKKTFGYSSLVAASSSPPGAVLRPDHRQRRKERPSRRGHRIAIACIDLIRFGLVPRPNGCPHAIGLSRFHPQRHSSSTTVHQQRRPIPDMDLLTINEVAAILKVSKSLVYGMIASGKIACHRIGNGREPSL